MVLSQLEESRSIVSLVCQLSIMAWEHISPEVTVKVYCGMAVKRMGMLRVRKTGTDW
jgi:hypothetical protein